MTSNTIPDGVLGMISAGVVASVAERIRDVAATLTGLTPVDETHPQADQLRRVWVARQVEQMLKPVTAMFVLEAESAGAAKQVTARTSGQNNSSHLRRRYPMLDDFRRGRVAAEVTGQPVTVRTPEGVTVAVTVHDTTII